MADFRKIITTKKGQELISKIIANQGNIEFTKISFSDVEYDDSQITELISVDEVKQTTKISKVSKISNESVQVEGIINNESLTEGYYIRTIALYAKDPDEGEILYAACSTSSPDWMAEFKGISTSGIALKLIISINDSSNVLITVDSAAVATINDINNLQSQIDGIQNLQTQVQEIENNQSQQVSNIENLQTQVNDIKGFVGYTDADIYGVEIDLKNSKFTRLAGATSLTAGVDFDEIKAFGGRKRCIITDNGVVLAYHGEIGYTESGKLTQQIIKNKVTYPVGTAVQVMVEQPKFYYKVVPLQLDKIEGGIGFHMRKARYYISDTKKAGFKVHPAFVLNGVEKNFIYLSAFEGCLFDTSAGRYLLNDEQVYASGDKLSSIANAKPVSGQTQNLSRTNCRALAAARGVGWKQQTIQSTSVTQMLFLIEYAMFDMQTAIGRGVTNKTHSNTINESEPTGETTTLGNSTGSIMNTSGFYPISYRGEENFYGNIGKWVDGININCKGMHEAYIAEDNYNDSKLDGNYKNVGFTIYKGSGYVSAFGYNKEFDWLFIPSECKGNSSLPVGDYFNSNNTYNGICAVIFNDGPNSYALTGGFYWNLLYPAFTHNCNTGSRLLYVPQHQ